MEPAAELEKQQQSDFAKRVNEMQKFLPCLEQRIENATQQNVKDEELRGWKLLRQVLCSEEQIAGMSGSLTLEDLDEYAAMLRDAENVPTKATSTKILDSGKESSKENNTSNKGVTGTPLNDQKKNAETDKKTNCTKNFNEEAKKPEDGSGNNKEVQNEDTSTKHLNGASETTASDFGLENNTLRKERIASTSDTSCVDSENKNESTDTARALQKNGNEDLGGEQKSEVVPPAVDKAQQNEEIFEPPDDLEEIEYEGVELIKMPEETAEDEMILPDSADEADFTLHESGSEEEAGEEGEEEEEQEEHQQMVNKDNERQVGEDDEDEEQQLEPTEGIHEEMRVEKDEEEMEVEKEEDEDGYDDKTESNENAAEKSAPLINADNEVSGDSVEIESVKYQEETTTHTSDSNSCKDVDDVENKNANDDNAAASTASDAEVEVIEETTTAREIEEEGSSNSLPAEHIFDLDSQSGHTHESTNDCDDPLGQAEATKERQNSQEAVETTGSTSKLSELHNDDDDDDDVEIIESRNSPICLDTDDDEEDAQNELNKKPNTRSLTTTTPKKIIDSRNANTITRTSIQAIKRTTETIDLLDSSDEETRSNMRRHPKRATNLRLTLTKSLVRMPTTVQQSTRGRKRTLLPTGQTHKPLKISQVLSGAAVPANCRAFNSKTQPATNAQTTNSTKSVLLFPPTSFKPTPQSNFLNAVNLLPTAATTGDNPLAFSATLSNKNIIIPNAFYANRRTTAKESEAAPAQKGESSTTTSLSPSAATKISSSEPAASTPDAAVSKAVPKVQTITVTQQQERVYREWLDEFIDNFANPQQIASHSCLVLLQSALKYKSFARIKDLRTALNTRAFTSNSIADGQLTRELHNNFYTPDCRLTSEGFRFCAAACTQIGNNVTLMADARTGRTTVRTSIYDELLAKYGLINNSGAGGTLSDDKRKRFKGDDEYTPAKYYENKVDPPKSGERRKSLRQHRTRCYDETYLYEPVEGEMDDEPLANVIRKSGGVISSKSRQEAQMMDLVQRKAEEKRLEAKRQREQQVKSFESAYLEMFANTLRDNRKVFGKKAPAAAADSSESATSSRRSTDTNNAPQIVIDDEEDEASFEDDEPRSHRIYKVVPTNLIAAPRYPPKRDDDKEEEFENIYDDTAPNTKGVKRGRPRKQDHKNMKTQKNKNEPELITCDSTSGDSSDNESPENNDAADQSVPKNVNQNWHAGTDWCRICNKRIPRTVAHYVNEHPNNEVYISRIQKNYLTRLRQQGGQILKMHPYINGQEQYAAECAFCNKTCCFKISYWYQHYAMHTGEYAYRCSGCNVRKPTRSAMTVHINQPCRKRGKLLEDYTYSPRSKYIEVRVCKLCNYTQLNQRNVWKHLRTQHGVKHSQKKNIESIILLRMPEPEVDEMLEDAKEFMDLSSGGDENGDSNQMAMTFNYDNLNDVAAQLDGVSGGMWDDGDPTDDLSYMICGMLDVEMKNDAV
ncbi:uncharacterized protein [Eurosta solidaginis]|uniref:uncharacterized protein n=1 Tax=Eurosta solidaginis TaxID=178769 RepID=UPI003531055C